MGWEVIWRGGLHKGQLHRVEGQYSKWKLIQTLSDNFVLKGFPAIKKEQEVGKVFFLY